MSALRRVSKAQVKVRREATATLRHLLDQGTPRKRAFLHVSRTLQAMGLPHSTRTIYAWCAEFKVKTT